MPEFSITVEVLHTDIDNVGRFNRLTRFKSFVQYPTGFQIANFYPVESLSLTRFDKFILDDSAGISID